MLNTPAGQILAQFGNALGMPELAFNEAGQCHLLIDRQHWVQLVLHRHDYILMSCPLAIKSSDPSQLSQLLKANFGQAAGGIVMALSPDETVCVQLALRCSDTACPDMLQCLEALLHEAERWNAHFAQAQQNPRPSSPTARLLAQTV